MTTESASKRWQRCPTWIDDLRCVKMKGHATLHQTQKKFTRKAYQQSTVQKIERIIYRKANASKGRQK